MPLYDIDMNNHSKHIACFISSEISMYLTESPELSANCRCSAVNGEMIVNQLNATFYSFIIKAPHTEVT